MDTNNAPFHQQDGQWYVEGVALNDIAAHYGTPCYVYSQQALAEAWHNFESAFGAAPHQICYAVKANSNLSILTALKDMGAGFDIVSEGELARVLHIGAAPEKIVFSGVGKTTAEIEAALAANIGCFNVESEPELIQLNAIAMAMGKIAPVALRVNPDIPTSAHPYISTGLATHKFGIPLAQARTLYQTATRFPALRFEGIDCHIGSQIRDMAPLAATLQVIETFVRELLAQGLPLTHINMGGGLGIAYEPNGQAPTPAAWVQLICQVLAPFGLKIYIEPGRAIVANAGILLSQITHLKQTPAQSFCIIDAGMNDCMRPALYQARHRIVAIAPHVALEAPYTVVGPICESSDTFGENYVLAVTTGDIVGIWQTGAYGFSMSSQYNSRPRAAEVLVSGEKHHCIRRRETFNDLFALEIR